MRNPRRHQSSSESDAAIAPVPEHGGAYAVDHNLPYRGSVDHGVDQPHVDMDDEHEWTGRPVVYEDEQPEPEPIPVRVVRGHSPREVRAFSAYEMPLQAKNRAQIAGRNESRITTYLKNPITNTCVIYIGPDSGVTELSGIGMDPGDTLTLTSTEPIYAYMFTPITAGTTQNLRVLVEYSKEYK